MKKKKNIGLFGELQEQIKKSEEGRKRLSSDFGLMRAEVAKQGTATQAALTTTQQKAEEAAQKASETKEATATIQTDVDGLKEEKSAKVELEKAQKTGAVAMQMAVSAGADVTENISVFKKAYPEWIADNGTEEVNHITYYPKTDMAYICIAAAQRIAVYAPDLATNNYCPYPEADENGNYPYVYGMLVWGGMKVKYEGAVYRCILADGSKYKLVYTPDAVPSVLTKEG
ncbi:hypothetical protein [Anaerotignum sp.]